MEIGKAAMKFRFADEILRMQILEKERMFPTDVVIVAGARTPMARYTGAFSEV